MNGNITGSFMETNISAIRETLANLGFDLGNGPEVILSAKRDDCTVHLYKTYTALLQGHGAEGIAKALVEENLLRLQEPKAKKRIPAGSSLTNMILPRIGSDESGKGDYFGPLVVAAVWIDEKTQELFEKIGVRDSKTLNDYAIRELAQRIRYSTVAITVAIGPDKYNELFRKIGTVNRILGWAHARAIENVLDKRTASLAVADQFGDESYIQRALLEKGKKAELRQMPKAESDTAVAAASIVARDEFVRRLETLGRGIGANLPKGASSEVVEAAMEIARRHGFDALRKLAKLHFKTTEQVRAAL